MEKQFGLKVATRPPRIPYRETVTKTAKDVEYTHKKQTGGAGQFARVFITMEPSGRGEGYEFIDEIFGGAIDQQFRPSVDKGIKAQMAEGVLAGYPVVDVKVRLTDGKTHPVDSKDIAFQIAGRQAFKEAFSRANPILLEPIVNMEVTTPSEFVGDIQGDLASRRGRPLGQDMLPGGFAVIKAVVPLAELSSYSSQLSSITGGQGSYMMELSHYDPVPGNLQQQIIEKAKQEKQEAAAH
jgi:elongation factor G